MNMVAVVFQQCSSRWIESYYKIILDSPYIPKTTQYHPINENYTNKIHKATTDNNGGADAAST